MITPQDKILAAIDAAATAAGFEAVHHPEWQNTGQIFIQPSASFESVLTLAYDFQNGYATIWTNPAPTPAAGAVSMASWPGGFAKPRDTSDWKGFRINYHEPASIEKCLAFVTQTLQDQSLPAREI